MGGFEFATGPSILVSGTLVPDATGTYIGSGIYGGKPYYTIASNYFCWWDIATTSWKISVLLGVDGVGWWFVVQPEVNGVYAPGGTATGTATVTKVP